MSNPTTISAGNTNINANTITLNGIGVNSELLTKSSNSGAITLPTSNATPGVTKTGTKKTAGEVLSDIASSSANLAGAYGNVVSKVQQMTGITLPNASDIPIVSNIISTLNTAANISTTLSTGQYGARTQSDSTNPQAGAFKWVEEETTPMDFVSYDSVLLFAGEPIYADNPKGATFTPIGMCEQLNISTSIQVTTLQELRCEEQIVLLGKSQPVTVSISRLCGKWSNLMNRLHNKKTDLQWCMSTQYKGMRDLFGLYCIVMDTSRRNIIHSFYIERCALESYSFGITAGQIQVIEGCTIRGGRIIDPNYVSQDTTTIYTTDTENSDSKETSKESTTETKKNSELVVEEKIENVGEIKRDSDIIFHDSNVYYISNDGIKASIRGTTAVERMESLSGIIKYADSDGTNCARSVSLAYGGDLANICNCDSLLNAAIKSDNFDVVDSKGMSIKTGKTVDTTKAGTLVMWNSEDNKTSNVHVVMVKDSNTTLNCGASHGTVGVNKTSATLLAGNNPINCYIVPK